MVTTTYDWDVKRFKVSNEARQKADALRRKITKFEARLAKTVGLMVVLAFCSSLLVIMTGLSIFDGEFRVWLPIASVVSIITTYIMYKLMMPYYEAKVAYYKNQKIY